MASAADVPSPAALEAARQAREHCAARRNIYLERLEALVGIDTGPDNRAGRNQAAELLAAWSRAAGLRVETLEHEPGLFVRSTLPGTLPGRVVFLGHHDTVFPLGTASARPLDVRGATAFGPGTADMKGGLLTALAAQEALLAGNLPFPTVELLSVPDEEVRNVPFATIDLVRGATAVLVFECGRENGDFVRARKTGAWMRMTAHGRPAHAGTEPDRGRSAILALCHEVLRCSALHGRRPGLTVTAGTIGGGSIPNVVPEDAEAVFDVRANEAADLDWLLERMAETGIYDGVAIELASAGRWPGIEPGEAGRRLAAVTTALSAVFGAPIGGQTTGGMSDGCWTAAEGVPTLDGFGPVGGNDHSPDEYIDLSSVAPRCGLAAGLARAVGDGLLENLCAEEVDEHAEYTCPGR
jgi:glutamate carboxypeptidase